MSITDHGLFLKNTDKEEKEMMDFPVDEFIEKSCWSLNPNISKKQKTIILKKCKKTLDSINEEFSLITKDPRFYFYWYDMKMDYVHALRQLKRILEKVLEINSINN